MTDLEDRLRARIAARRRALRISQVELARRVGGMDGTTITRIEHGQRRITLNEAAAIAAALEMGFNDLAGPFPAPTSEGNGGATWHVGRELGRMIYREVNGRKECVGIMDTADLADVVVAAVNRLVPE